MKINNYNKPERVINSLSNNYIEYEINGHRNNKLSVEQYLIKISPPLKDIIIIFKNATHEKFNQQEQKILFLP